MIGKGNFFHLNTRCNNIQYRNFIEQHFIDVTRYSTCYSYRIKANTSESIFLYSETTLLFSSSYHSITFFLIPYLDGVLFRLMSIGRPVYSGRREAGSHPETYRTKSNKKKC